MRTLRYGSHPSQVGDLYPAADRAAPLLVLLHGGFWRMPYGLDECDGLALDLQARGYSVWNLEYRRVGESGGGWPAAGADVLQALRGSEALKSEAVTPAHTLLIGFSAGGHLALWAGKELGRAKLSAVIALAPVADLRLAAERGLGRNAAQGLLGGGPAEVPERYREASPAERLPAGVRQVIIHGVEDDAVPIGMSRAYVERAKGAGDQVELLEIARGRHEDHLVLTSPSHAALVGWLAREFGTAP